MNATRKTFLLYGLAIAAAAFALQWAEHRLAMRAVSTELYVVLIALAFTALGLWAGSRLTARVARAPVAADGAAAARLGISARECEVLALLAEGRSNKEIARGLDVSPNTVKTHLAKLYAKLEVSRRTQATVKAKALGLLG